LASSGCWVWLTGRRSGGSAAADQASACRVIVPADGRCARKFLPLQNRGPATAPAQNAGPARTLRARNRDNSRTTARRADAGCPSGPSGQRLRAFFSPLRSRAGFATLRFGVFDFRAAGFLAAFAATFFFAGFLAARGFFAFAFAAGLGLAAIFFARGAAGL